MKAALASSTANVVATFGTNPLLARLLSFATLPDGWHYGRGKRIDPRAILVAFFTDFVLKSLGAKSTEVFPTINGGVLVSGYRDDICVDATVTTALLIDCVVERGDEEQFDKEGLSFPEFVGALREGRWLSEKSYTSCTPHFSVLSLDDTNLRRLMNHQMISEYRLSFSAASKILGTMYAATSENSIAQILAASHRSSGDSETLCYHLGV